VLKLQHRRFEAGSAYLCALILDPGLVVAREESLSLGYTADKDTEQMIEEQPIGRSPDYFPTQYRSRTTTGTDSTQTNTITGFDRTCGAPHAPIPRSFFVVDPKLEVCQEIPSADEIKDVLDIRQPFSIPGYPKPFVTDVVRAFRLLKDKSTYLEIGIFDRGNLAYASSILSPNAVLIGVDTQEETNLDNLLITKLKKSQTYETVVGNSRASTTVSRVKSILGKGKLDAVFIDGDHTAYGAMSDYALYENMISSDGIVLFHDSVWEGAEGYKGVADALAEIDKIDPVYLIDASNPCRRFMRPMWRDQLWGVVGVVFASDQVWRRR
jgi:hypothetical protein